MGKTGEHTIEFMAEESGPIGRPASILTSLAAGLAKRILHIDALNDVYRNVMQKAGDAPFVDRALEVMGVSYALPESDRSRIPQTGPVIVVANHPFGGIEGIILCSIMLSARPDSKIMANYLLERIKADQFREMCIFVDPLGGKESVGHNVQSLRKAIRWVRAGGMLGVFPAGEVAHLRLRKGSVTDPEWNDTVARIIRMTKASVLPVFFDGCNGPLFQLLGLLHPRLRTILLPREMLNKRNKQIPVRIGKPIDHHKLSKFGDDRSMMKYLRFRTYLLKNGKKEEESTPGDALPAGGIFQPIVPPQPSEHLRREIAALPPDQLLVDTGSFAVYRADAGQIPHILQEIGRLREITFRQAGEGTGKSMDLDRHDDFYTHLLLWGKERGEVVGGYRLGLTEDILPRFGKNGLYTASLFEYQDRFFDEIGPAIELGRSFVRAEYQKSFHPLMLLWKGIGRFVSEHPECRTLFGPVSINNNYLSISRRLIVAFSRKSGHASELSRLVRGRHPLENRNPAERKRLKNACSLLENIQDLSEIVSDIENDRKGIPILLKHYMKLGGEFLAFSIDRNFNDVMDALIVVDLTRTDPKILDRYMGRDAAGSFLRRHRGASLVDCA